MSINWRYVAGITTITGVLGLTAYSIVLYKRQKKQDEGSMSAEEARNFMVSNKEIDFKDYPNKTKEEFEEAFDKVKETLYEEEKESKEKAWIDHDRDEVERKIVARHLKEVEEENEQEDLEQIEEELREDEIDPEPVLLEDEGEGKLRYDPNSDEALLQFMRMELAEWAPYTDTHKTLLSLFDVTFEPDIDGDKNLYSKIYDYRAEFFGPASRWTPRVTFSDLILHFSRLADYNLGGGVKYWAEYFLELNGINVFDKAEDDMLYEISLMNDHRFVNYDEGTYGLFGLTEKNVEKAVEIASKNIDNSLTYEIEFNEFLKNSSNIF